MLDLVDETLISGFCNSCALRRENAVRFFSLGILWTATVKTAREGAQEWRVVVFRYGVVFTKADSGLDAPKALP